MAGEKKIWVYLCVGILAYTSFLMLRIIWAYAPMHSDTAFLQLKQQYINIPAWRTAFYIHVFSSFAAMLAGFTQFSAKLLKRKPALHRALGYTYVINILVVTGPAGLLMSFYANGGIFSQIGFILLSVLWILFTALALYKAIKKQFNAHRIFMIRSFALTLSAVSLRLWKVILANFTDIPPMDRYRIIAWLGWGLNLLIAEYIIYRLYTSKKTRKKMVAGISALFIVLIPAAVKPGYGQEISKKFVVQSYRQDLNTKDKAWIDSLKKIISKGYGDYEYSRRSYRKTSTFVNSCATLGLYYEKLFDKGVLPDMKQAVKYYKMVIDVGTLPYAPQVFEASAMKKTMHRKLADIYFRGKGVKKNKQVSLDYAAGGISDENMFRFYSHKYFGNHQIFRTNSPINDYVKDTMFFFTLNPLAPISLFYPLKYSEKKEFIAIKNAFVERLKVEELDFSIRGFYPTGRGQRAFIYWIQAVAEYFKSAINIPGVNFSEQSDSMWEGSEVGIEIRFIKK